jgi:hypothetical protein
MPERTDLLVSIAATTADYRAGEVAAPTPDHVERWVNQFDAEVQLPILREIDHVLKRTYFSKETVGGFLKGLITNDKLVGNDPIAFWRAANFLDIQQGGGSQHDLLSLFDENLRTELGIGINECGGGSTFLYIDDAVFTGGRVKSDLTTWIADAAPQAATVHVLVIAIHEGFYYNRDKIVSAAQEAGKAIDIKWWRLAMFENRKFNRNSSDILWPVEIPDDAITRAHVGNMGHQPVLRVAGQTGTLSIFSSDAGRQLLEQEFLKAGTRIRQICPNLPEIERPLGHSYLETLGFGSTLVTYRNCPNNAALALWVGNPWHPLFPRKTNADSRLERLFRGAN